MTRTHRPKERADFLRWLEAQPKPIAIMTSADILAKLVIDYATELDLSVPGDVAVLGVGNHQWLCTITDIQISSVVPNHRQVGYRAAALLDELLNGKPCPPTLRIPPIGVAARQSTDIELTVDPLVTAALTYIRQNISESPSVAEIARHVAVSRRTLQMRMQKAVGYSPREAISNERLR
jgi:LacI family transcriptional regulator